MHFGTFQLTSEGIDEPLRARACGERNVQPARFRTLEFGESVLLASLSWRLPRRSAPREAGSTFAP